MEGVAIRPQDVGPEGFSRSLIPAIYFVIPASEPESTAIIKCLEFGI